MTESSPPQITRLEFLKTAAAFAGSLFLTESFDPELAAAETKERFSANPSWVQDFSAMPDGAPDPRYWNYVLGNTVPGYNDEAETLTKDPTNVRIQDGLLVIEARVQHKNKRNYTSAEIDTQGKFGFTYGKLEVELRLPKGIGTWPAAWLLPTNPRYNPAQYGLKNTGGNNWLLNGEIDFMETVGSEAGRIYPDIHTVQHDNAEKKNPNPKPQLVPDDADAFHTYGVEKLADSIVFTLDGKPYRTIHKTSDSPLAWPFDQQYYLIVNLAMGGSWGGMDKAQFPDTDGIDTSKAPWQYLIRSIRFYDLAS